MSAWARLTVGVLSVVLLAACGGDSNGNGGGNPPPDPVLQEIRIIPAVADLPVGLSLQYAATGVYSDGSESDLSNSVSWASASQAVASIDGNGLATALLVGVSEISASENGVEGSAQLTVTEAELVTVGVFPPAAQLKRGATQDYRAFAVFSDGSLENVTFSANWSLQGESGILAPYEPLLTLGLNNLDDFATAIAVDVGSDVLIATLGEESADEQSGTSTVNVTESELLTLRIAPRSDITLVGGTIQYQATGLYADGSAADLTKVVLWSSADTGTVKISNAGGERGLAVALAVGDTEISAGYLELSDSTPVQVLASDGSNPIEKIDVFPPLQSLNTGALQRYTAVAYLADGTAVDITRDAGWSSSEESVAIISNTLEDTGLALAVGPGISTIAASFQDFLGEAELEVRAAGDSELLEISVEPLQSVLQSFTTRQFLAIGIYGDGSKRDITGQVTWGSSDSSIIQISNSAIFGNGLALALSTGEVLVTATQPADAGAVQGDARVTVIEAENIPGQLLVSPPVATSIVGDNQQYEATLVLESGVSADVTDSVVWSSSDPLVARIDDTGLATAGAPGETDINASLIVAGNTLSGSALFRVKSEEVSVVEVLVDPPLAEIIVDDTQAYTAWAVLSDGSTVDVSDVVNWSSSDSDVAQINLSGIAIGLAAGTTRVRALLDYQGENHAGEAQLGVKPEGNTVRSLAISPLVTRLLVGGEQQYQAEAILTDGSRVDVTEEVTWSSSDESIAQITSNGLAHGESAGEIDVGAVLVLSYGQVSGRAILKVVEPDIESMEVLPVKSAAAEGTTRKYTAIATISDGSTLDVSEHAAWIALDPAVARIGDTGLAFALQEGETGIFAALEYDDQRFDDIARFTVKKSRLDLNSLVVTPAAAEVLTGGTRQYTATAYFSDGSRQDVSDVSDWRTSSSAVAQVDGSGLATGLFPGDAVVRARFSFRDTSLTADAGLRVVLPPGAVSDIVVSPPDGDILVGEQLQYSARVIFANGYTLDITDLSTWTSVLPHTASVEPSTGLATGTSAGSTTIIAAVVIQGQSYQGNADLLVNADPPNIIELIINPPVANILVDSAQQYSAVAVLSDNTTVDVSTRVDWGSSDTTVAWIDGRGLATGIDAGIAEIGASLVAEGETYSDTAQLAVEAADAPVTEIVVAPSSSQVLVAGTRQYIATAIFADGHQLDVTDAAIWESADTRIAVIDATALATGGIAGTTEISAMLILSSGGFSDAAQLEVKADPVQVDELVVTPATAEILITAIQPYTATALLSDGSSVDVTDEVAWVSSDSEVAHVDIKGLATGLAEGKADITATLAYQGETFSDSGRLTVKPPDIGIEEIQVTPVLAELLTGEKLQYTATAILSDGSHQDVTRVSDWTSSDSAVAQINTQARATAIAAGETQINASLGYQGEVYQGSAVLEVKDQSVGIESLVVDPPLADILIGTTQAFTAHVILTDGSSHDVTESADWSSSDSDVASVDDDGIALGLAGGRSEINASIEYQGEHYSDAGRLTVQAREIEIVGDILVEPLEAVIVVGGTQAFTATVQLSDGSELNVTRDVTWQSSDGDVATITQSGRATGLAEGDALVTATLLYNDTLHEGNASLGVTGESVTVEQIVVDPPGAEVVIGSHTQYTATAILSDGSQIPVTDDVTWSSAEASVAQVDDQGSATGLAEGETEILAELKVAGDLYSDSGRIIVKAEAATIEELVVAPQQAEVLVDGRQQFTATAYLSDGSRIDVTRDSSWLSADESIAHVNELGRATGLAAGESGISASFTYAGDSWSDTAGLQVKAPDITIGKLRVEPALSSVLVGGEQVYIAVAELSDGSEVDVTGDVSWNSSLPAVATISTAGIATGLSEGEATIIATLVYLDQPTEGEATLRVKPPAVTVEDLVVAPQFAEVFNEEQQQYTATAILSDGSELPVTRDVTWTSADYGIAQVNSTGLVTGVSEGATQITATLVYEGGTISDGGDIQVNGAELTGLVVTPATATVAAGAPQQFTAVAIYSDGSNSDVSSLAFWQSSDATVAEVDSSGLVTTLVAGRSSISATFEGLSGEGRLTVNAATVTNISILPGSISAPLGTSGQLQLLATFSDGSQENVAADGQWSSADSEVAQVVASGAEAGYTTLAGIGASSISTIYQGLSDTVPVEVNEAELVDIQLQPLDASVGAGTQVQYTATGIYSDGSKSDLTDEVSWSSDVAQVATIDADGLADTHAADGTTIRAVWQPPEAVALELSEFEVSTPLTVTAATVESINIVPAQVSAPVGTQAQLELFATYSDGTTADVTATGSWISTDNVVATVVPTGEDAGLVSLLQEGETTVTASFEGLADNTPIQVSAAALRSVVVTPAEDAVPTGLSRQFTATAWYSDDSSTDVTRQAAWSSSAEDIAKVDGAGLATGIAAGTSSIAVLFEELSDDASLTVTAAVPTGVDIIPGVVDAPLGTTGQLQLFADYSDGSRQEVTTEATWTSADETVAVIITSGEKAGQGQLVGVGSTPVSASYQGLVDSIPVAVSPAKLTELQVTPADAIVASGVVVLYTATGLYSDGTTRDLSSESSWSSSDTAVAAVGGDGVANTYGAGTTTITASYAGITATTRSAQKNVSATVPLQVTPAQVQSVTVLPGPIEGAAGSSSQLQLDALYTDGTVARVTQQADWMSDAPGTASVESTGATAGRVELLVEGVANITAGFGGQSNTVTVNVTAAELTQLVVTPSQASVPVGLEQQFKATAYYSDASSADVTAKASWQSGDKAVASVNDAALAIGRAPGTTAITATFDTVPASAILDVTDAIVTSLQIIPGEIDAPLGTSEQLALLASFSDNTQKDVTTQALWVSANPLIAAVVPNDEKAGYTTLVGTGAAEIRAGYGGESTSIPVSVSAAALADLVVNPVDDSVAAGFELQYSATGIYTDGSNADLTDEVHWSSSETAVATIDQTGLARSFATGDTGISASYLGSTGSLRAVLSGKDAQTSLTVTAANIESLQIIPGAVAGPRGSSNQLQLTAYYSDGSNADVTAQATWASTDPAIVSVTTGDADAGFIQLLNPGGARIEAYLDGLDTFIPVVVTPAQLERLEVQPQEASIAAGLEIKYTAWGFYSDDTVQDLSTEASWISSDKTVASVDGNGLARGIAFGTSTISASIESFSSTARIMVTAADLTDLQIEPGSLSMPLGSDAQLTLTAFFSDGSSQDVTTSATWTSGDTAVAAVVATGEKAGTVSGKGEGSTSIFAAFDGESTSVPVMVTAAQLELITVSPADTSTPLGQTLQYSAEGAYSDDTVRDITDSVNWRSTDTEVATVDQTGRTQTHGIGVATISAGLSGISGSGLLQVTDAAPEQLLVTPDTVTGPVGSTIALEATAVFSDGSREDVTQDTVWASSAPEIAEVVPSGVDAGQLSLRGEGSAEIRASYATLNAVFVPVDVSGAILESIAIAPLEESAPLGTDVQYIATGTYSDGSTEDISSEVTWQSSDTGVATISSEGLADTLTAGATNITARLAGVSSQTPLTVTDQVAVGLQIIPPFVSGPDGTSGPLLALALFTDGSVENVSSHATWSTADADIVTVTHVTGARLAQYNLEAPGSSEITATFDSFSSTIPVTVEAADLVSIEVSPNSVSTAVGLEAEFTATGFYSNGDTATLTDEVLWTSSDTTVSQFTEVDGVALAVAEGSAGITASLEEVSGEAQHVVTAAQAVELVITPPLWSDPAGTSQPFTARAIYTDGSDADVTQESSWSSTDQLVATVGDTGDQAGIVNLLDPGLATITAQLGSVADSSPVIVTAPVVIDIVVEPYAETYPEQFLVRFRATATYSDGDTTDVTDEAVWRSDDSSVAITGEGGEVYTIAPGEAGIEAAFGGQPGAAPITVVTASVTDLQVEPGFIDDPSGARIQLEATAFYDNKQSQDVTQESSWVSADESRATVVAEGENAGLTELTGVGATTITASYQGVPRTINVTVAEAVLEAIIVEPADATIAAGLSRQYQALGVYSDGSSGPVEEAVVWTSSAESIASIGAGGLVQTLAVGQSVISASLDGITGSTNLTVSNATVVKLNVDPAVDTRPAGALTPLTVTALLSDGRTEDVTAISQWQVVGGGGATVLPVLGVLSHNSEGLTLIQASLPEFASSTGAQASLLANTTAATLQRIELTPDPLTVELGVPASYLATGYYSDNTSSPLNAEADWSVADSSIATVSELGEVNGVAPGATTVTAAVGDISDSADLIVEDTVLDSIQITPADIVAPAGTRLQMTARGYYTNGENEDLTELVLWTSDDETVALVASGPEDGGDLGLVAVGDAIVTAVLDGIVSNNALISVTDAELLAIEVTPSDVDVPRGATQQFSAVGIYTDGERPLDKDMGLLWSSSPIFAATINEDGVATAVGFLATTATITARVEGVDDVSGEARLQVTDAVIDSLVITPAGLREPAGSSVQLTATAYYSFGPPSDVTQLSAWQSSDPAIATVVGSGEEAGFVQLLSPGDVEISAAFDGEFTAIQLEVTAAVLVDILIDPPRQEVPAGFAVDYSATGVYSDGSIAPLKENVTWQSSDLEVATIDADGVADTVAPGTTSITATSDGISGESALLVSNAVIESIEVSADKSELFEGEVQQYTATALLSDMEKEDVTNDVTWSVSPDNIAEISNFFDTAGQLEARAAGVGEVVATMAEESARSSEFSVLLATGSKDLTVKANTIVSIDIDDAGADQLFVGQTADWTAEGLFSNGETTDVTDTATWTSSDSTTVTVEVIDGTARLTAVADVDAIVDITAVLGTAEDVQSVAVVSREIEDINIQPDDPDALAVGSTEDFIAIATMNDGSQVNVTEDVDWLALDSDGDPSTIAQFEEEPQGRVLALAEGVASIAVTTRDGDSYSGPDLTVVEKQAEGLIVEPGSLDMPAESEWPFLALVRYTDGSTDDVTRLVLWSTSDDNVVTISNAEGKEGLATAGKAKDDVVGSSAEITATLSNDEMTTTAIAVVSITEECAKNKDYKIDSIEVIPGPLVIIKVGETRQLIGIGTFIRNNDPGDSCQQSTTTSKDAHWHSSDEDIVDVPHKGDKNDAGRITGISVGAVQIDNEWDKTEGYTTVIVEDDNGEGGSLDCVITSNEVPDTIEIVPSEAKIKSDRTGQYAAIATWRDGACYSDVSASSLLEWSSADEDICTIDDQGVVTPTGKKKDETEISAVYDGSDELTDEASCEVD